MRKLISILSTFLISLFASQAFAGDGHNHDNKKHCEKKVDGKTVHLDHVKNRKQCKQEGGRWVKHKKKKDDHDHGSHKDGDQKVHKNHEGHDDHKDGDSHQH